MLDDRLQTFDIYVEAPGNTIPASLIRPIGTALSNPGATNPFVRTITKKMSTMGVRYDTDEKKYVVFFRDKDPVTPATCRLVRDILHAQLGIDKDRFNELNPLALSAQPSASPHPIRNR